MSSISLTILKMGLKDLRTETVTNIMATRAFELFVRNIYCKCTCTTTKEVTFDRCVDDSYSISDYKMKEHMNPLWALDDLDSFVFLCSAGLLTTFTPLLSSVLQGS